MNTPADTNRRILVVDDNPAIHSDFKKILCPGAQAQSGLDSLEAEIFGSAAPAAAAIDFEVDSALQGQDGLALVKQAVAEGRPYAVIFMDVRMPPGWDGIETTARIWEVFPDVQIVICTAYSDYSWDEMTARLGISDRLVILKKPFDNVEVTQLAHALAEKWRVSQAARLKLEQMEAMVAERTHKLAEANEKLKKEMAERARTEEALRQSQKMEALGQLAGGIAHDFNNLLSVIRGYVDCLLAEDPAGETLEALQEIDRAAERAAKLTAQILMFSRKKRMQAQVLNLNDVISHSANLLRRLLGETIALRVRSEATGLMVQADPVMIEQVLINLATNARDAMPGGGTLTIEAAEIDITEEEARTRSKWRAGRFVRVSVADTGPGIAEAVLPHLFDPFFTTKEPGKGTGLGLATVYGILQQHAGWVDADNCLAATNRTASPISGARFTFYLPVSVDPGDSVTQKSAKAKIPGGNETILLVEDEPGVHRLARNILQRQGYRVLDANDGREALVIWSDHAAEIDLLLTDMVMPGDWSGQKLAEKLKSEKASLKVIYTTGYSQEALNMDAALHEGVNFVAKPYTLEKLACAVRRCLDSGPLTP